LGFFLKGSEMKFHRFIVILGVLVVCAMMLTGCGTTSSYKQADKTFGKMEALKSELLDGKVQIEKMIPALNQVVATADSDPRPAYELFKEEYTNTQKQADKVRKTAEQMKKEGQAYFKAWEAEFEKVASEDMRQRFEKRKAELASQYDKISDYAQQVKVDFEQFEQNISDISVVLSVDLTSAGIKSISNDVKKVTKESVTIKEHIDKYVEVIDKVAEIVRPSVGP
jgi:hypothetical protein